jgi:hypothetical protein
MYTQPRQARVSAHYDTNGRVCGRWLCVDVYVCVLGNLCVCVHGLGRVYRAIGGKRAGGKEKRIHDPSRSETGPPVDMS